MKHIVNLIVGDWSNDGHGRTDTIAISCNRSSAKLEAAYQKGSKLCGVTMEDVASDYEDSSINEEDVAKLKEHGASLEKLGIALYDANDECGGWIFEDGGMSFAKTWLFIASLGDPKLEYKFTKSKDIHVGGYGLLS